MCPSRTHFLLIPWFNERSWTCQLTCRESLMDQERRWESEGEAFSGFVWKKWALYIPTGSNRMIIIFKKKHVICGISKQFSEQPQERCVSCKGSFEVPAPFSSSIQDGYLEVGEIMQAQLDGDLSEITHGWYVTWCVSDVSVICQWCVSDVSLDMSVICQWYYS